jgi:signal transduction histidine kinase
VEQERSELLATLNRKKADLQRLLHELLATQEKERRHLSHELHDEIVQLLTAADSYMQGVENHLSPAGLPAARAVLEKARTQIGKAGARCRRLVLELRPPDLERLGLVGALTNLLKASGAPRTQVIATEEGPLNALPWEDQMVIFRVAQEAIQNIRKHAQANEIELSIAATAERVRWKIRDDGRGFDPEAEAKPGHFGLIGMRERVELAGGTLQVKSRPGAGTEVEAHLPLIRQEARFKVLEGGEPGSSGA